MKFPDFIVTQLDWLANQRAAKSLADALRHRLRGSN